MLKIMKKALISVLQVHKLAAGSARNTFEQIRYFKSRGYEVHVAAMTMDKEKLIAAGAIAHQTFPWPKKTGLWRRRWYNFQVQLLIKKLKPDLVVGHGDLVHQDVLCLHNSVHLAYELMNDGKQIPANHEMNKVHGELLTFHEKNFKHMIANSELMKKDAINRFGISDSKITVVYPSYMNEHFKPVLVNIKNQHRQKLNFSSDKLIIGLITSGNFKKRGLDIFIEALSLISSEWKSKIEVKVVGKDDEGVFNQLIKKHHLQEIVKFMPVIEDVQEYYQAIDLFVLPARVEEFGRVVLEAMACGCPVVTTQFVGASELLEDGVIKELNPQKLKDAMENFLIHEDLRKKVGEKNARLALEHSEEELARKFDKVFTDQRLLKQF
jgi:UDP-glucose:(heptosyl)LPS alpha-1,3-glucosyltransferase